ncbi:MAG TPA: lysozyme inhibitor LprI family protein [Terriglobales bacterium]
MNKTLPWVQVLILLTSFAWTQQEPAISRGSAAKDPCDNAMSQMEMNQCSGEQYRKADARLSVVYHKALTFLAADVDEARHRNDNDETKHGATSIQKLKAAERAWIQYRDLHCDAAGHEYEGGSMRPMMWANCMKLATEHRVANLKEAYEDGDRKLE